MTFEILCLDADENVECKSLRTFLYALMANDTLLNNPSMNEADGEIIEEQRNIQMKIVQFSTDRMLMGNRYSAAYVVSVNCDDISALDGYRVSLVDYVRKIGFSNIRILVDDVSMSYAGELYPILYKLENKVRAFVVNFFLKNLGPNWTKFALSLDVLEKIKKRQRNDRIFIEPRKVESDVSLIDFDELGKILYNENSILSSRKADNVSVLIEKISSADDLDKLKEEVLQGNFYKYFKDCFTQKDFQTKWMKLYYFRNKIAHNGSLSKEECEEFKRICEDINAIIDGAYKKLDTFQLSMSDQEALVKAANEFAEEKEYSQLDSHASAYDVINEETLLTELRQAEERLDFVGLRYFVVTMLGEKGYDYASSFVLINHLVDKGVLAMKQITNEKNHLTTVIKLANPTKDED